MPVTVRIPTPLRKLTKDQPEVEAAGSDIESLLENLEANYSGIKERICDESGEIRRFVNIYLNDEDIRFLDGNATSVKDGDEISIIPAIAGGRGKWVVMLYNEQCGLNEDEISEAQSASYLTSPGAVFGSVSSVEVGMC